MMKPCFGWRGIRDNCCVVAECPVGPLFRMERNAIDVRRQLKSQTGGGAAEEIVTLHGSVEIGVADDPDEAGVKRVTLQIKQDGAQAS